MKSLNKIKETSDNTQSNNKLLSMNDYIEDVKACPGLESVVKKIEPLINAEMIKLLCGENGTGKGVIAQYIHARSNKSNGRFVAINMACFTAELLMSELCGCTRGSYTGAIKDRIGLFQYAENGTIFLDEINSISLENQAKLLKIIEDREVYPIGSLTPVKINCRIIIGTNSNLEEMVNQGTFRKDLYYRISGLEFTIPPLRDRRQDIPILVNRLISKISEEIGGSTPDITNEAIALLTIQNWFGNVRELFNILYLIVHYCNNNLISVELVKEVLGIKNTPLLQYKEAVVKYQKEIIEAILSSTPSITESAKLLGIPYSTLRDKIKQLEINVK